MLLELSYLVHRYPVAFGIFEFNLQAERSPVPRGLAGGLGSAAAWCTGPMDNFLIVCPGEK